MFLLRLLCLTNGLNYKDPASKKEKKIELPFNYITYIAIGLHISFLAPFVFRLLDMQRDYSYTEL